MVAYPSRTVFTLDMTPRKIDGRVYRFKDGALGYEAPTLQP